MSHMAISGGASNSNDAYYLFYCKGRDQGLTRFVQQE